MRPVLLVEASVTRRRAASTVLAQHGFATTALASHEQAYDVLQRHLTSANRFEGVVLGWPEYSDGVAEDVFGLLHSDAFEHLPVLILADRNNESAANWRLTRPRTGLLLWGDFQETGAALEQLLRPPERTQLPTQRAPSATLRILLVDDSATVRAGFSRLLLRSGYEVETANSVAEGLEAARAGSFDIAIVDYYMPEANGTELIARLREQPETSEMLTAIITGTYSDAVIRESLALGAVECLFKSEAKELFLARLASLARTVNNRKAIDAERRRLQGILSSVGDGVYGVDEAGVIQFVNPAALDLLGYSQARELTGHRAFDCFHGADEHGATLQREESFLDQCYANGEAVPNWQGVFWTAARRSLPVECTVFPMTVDGQRTGSVVAFRDVSARRMLEEELRWQAEHDPLTKLHNRGWFEVQLEKELTRLKRSEQSSLLLFVDLDRFKYINDTAGHSAGDQLLCEVSNRLRSRLRGSDHLARMGGDEYALILRNVNVGDIESIADGFRQALTATPFVHAGKSYRITLSIGVVKMDSQTASLTEAMAHADIACHMAKRSGRNRTHLYTEESGRKAALDVDLGWSARIEDALKNDRFLLAFQPIVPLNGLEEEQQLRHDDPHLWVRQLQRNPEQPAIFEVLLRLRDAQGDLISPHAFLPSAERFSMMPDIDRWVVDRALRVARSATAAPRKVVLTINLSADSLGSDGFAGYVITKLVEHNVSPDSLVFEITESRAIEDVAGVQQALHDLRQHGCRIAVDDFGTGFSTFAYLKQLEADILKVDGSLIQGLPDDPLDRTIIAALTSIAETAGKHTIAEFVEDARVLMSLYECGVDYAQGNALGMPQIKLELPASLATADRLGNDGEKSDAIGF
ncbi:MAG: EAL domain-containing protein [Lysobacteraceae bacterium]